MSDAAMAGLRELALPLTKGKTAIDRASKQAGLSYWRSFDIWYRKARRIEPFEVDAIERAIQQKRREAARNELHELRTRLVRLESLLARGDADFHRPSIDALGDQLREVDRAARPKNRAVD